MLRVSKEGIWFTVQGEGLYTGVPSTFFRLAGCNLRCAFCDSQKTLPDYDIEKKAFGVLREDLGSHLMSIEDVVKGILSHDHLNPYPHLVVTGGEPLLQQHEVAKVLACIGLSHVVTVETNCESEPEIEFGRRIDLASLSPKLYRWTESSAVREHILSNFIAWHELAGLVQIKVVVCSEEDLNVAMEMIVSLRESVNERHIGWVGVQLESSWLRRGWLEKDLRKQYLPELSRYGIRLVAQMHPVLHLA